MKICGRIVVSALIFEKRTFMGTWELIITAIGLAMDAFAVAICKGLSTCRVKIKHMVVTGLWFGGFQAAMPLLGYLLGKTFRQYIESVDHWIAFALLVLLGLNMLKEALSKDNECSCTDASLAFSVMLTMAIATSIDALAVGITFALIAPTTGISVAVILIGVITFALSFVGVVIGNKFGAKYKKRAELAGGIILCLMGLKILLEHLEIINF
jgi:putative Mn2+ efflux pump MntP